MIFMCFLERMFLLNFWCCFVFWFVFNFDVDVFDFVVDIVVRFLFDKFFVDIFWLVFLFVWFLFCDDLMVVDFCIVEVFFIINLIIKK